MISINRDADTTIQSVKHKVSAFVSYRNWEQFHDLKNLSMAISSETAELMEHFLWLKNDESLSALEKNKTKIEEEIADIAILLLDFCNTADIDLASAIENKLLINDAKYPVELSKNCSKKYSDLGG